MRYGHDLQSIKLLPIDHNERKTTEKTKAGSMEIGGPTVRRQRDLLKRRFKGRLKSASRLRAAAKVPAIGLARSEERRVGKECRL